MIDPHDVDICLSADGWMDDWGAESMSTPVVQTSLFAFPDFQSLLDGLAAEHHHHVYSRGGNPTVEAFEQKLAALEHGQDCIAFGSGMGAVSAVMMGLLQAGDHVLFVNHVYGPTLELARHLGRFGVEHDVLLDREKPLDSALRPNTRLVWMESPGTMLFRMIDIDAVAAVARERGVTTVLDNSWATPLFQKPIDAGIDVVVHSASKYIGGHSDLMAGAVVGGTELMHRIFRDAYMLNGATLGPWEAWLLLRGLRTLPTRMRQHEADALEVARFLDDHDGVRRVFHPAVGEDAELAGRQLAGTSGLFSFELDTDAFDDVREFIDSLERFRIGVSWGGTESLVLSPNNGRNGADLDAAGIPRGTVRVSIGLEGARPLIDDLTFALDAIS